MRIKGHNGLPIITCLGNYGTTSSIMVTISDVYLENAILSLSNINITIINSLFHNVSLTSGHQCHQLNMLVRNSTFSKAVTCQDLSHCNAGDHDVICSRINITLDQVRVYDSKFHIRASYSADIHLYNSTFTKILQNETGMGGVNVSMPARHGHLRVRGCVFSHLVHWEPILSAINIEAAALRVESLRPFIPQNATSDYVFLHDNSINIINTHFIHNERALSISRSFKSIEIHGCIFAHNQVMHAAAAVRLALQVLQYNYVHL